MLPKQIVIYNQAETKQKSIEMNIYKSRTKIDIFFKEGPPNSTHIYISSYPAYFLHVHCMGNLYHMWVEFIVGLYGILKDTNRLESNERNQVILLNAMHTSEMKQCNNHKKFSFLIETLGVRADHNSYHAFNGICYRNAVFGLKPFNLRYSQEEIITYIKKHISVTVPKCKPKTITIIQRTHRRILNIDQLKTAAIELGLTNTNIFNFEKIPVDKQYQIIRCTHILIGINGAALQWNLFMEKGHGLFELSWKEFGFFFAPGPRHRVGLKTARQTAKQVFLNWHTFSLQCRSGRNISESEKNKILSRKRIIGRDNPYKWGDAIFNVTTFKKELHMLAKGVFGSNFTSL